MNPLSPEATPAVGVQRSGASQATEATAGDQRVDIDFLSHRARRGWLRRIWNDKILVRSQGSHPGLLAVLAILVLVLGTIGIHRTDAHLSILDDVYNAMSLFVINTTLPANPNLALNIARFLAPILVFYAALGVVFALYRDTFKRARIRRLRDHVVVAGLGVSGFRIARAFSDQNFPVVAIETDSSNPTRESCGRPESPMRPSSSPCAATMVRTSMSHQRHVSSPSSGDLECSTPSWNSTTSDFGM